VWSVGCIYAQLLGMLVGTETVDRAPLFPGMSCFPQSPHPEHRSDYRYYTRGNQDMLCKIFNILGTPSDTEVAELDREDAKTYVRCFQKRTGTGLRAAFPHVDGASVDFLEQVLRFSPTARASVETALAHPLLLDIRDAASEATAPALLEHDFEVGGRGLDEEGLRSRLWEEQRRYQEGQV